MFHEIKSGANRPFSFQVKCVKCQNIGHNDRFSITRFWVHSSRKGIRARYLEGFSLERETRSLLEVKFTQNGTVCSLMYVPRTVLYVP